MAQDLQKKEKNVQHSQLKVLEPLTAFPKFSLSFPILAIFQ